MQGIPQLFLTRR